MDPSTWWWLLAGAAVVAELLTGTLYLLLLAVGLISAAVAAWLGSGLSTQLLLAAAVGGAQMTGWFLWRRRRPAPLPASRDPGVNPDLGQTVQVLQWAADGTASARYRGAAWSVALEAGQPARPGPQCIVEVLGNRLIVRPL